MPTAPARPCPRSGCRHLQPCPEHRPHTQPGQRYADRKQHEPWRALYSTQQWRRRRSRFLHVHPLCCACEQHGTVRLATVVDHITPHRGDERLMWDETNWQALCTQCHARKTAYEMNNAKRGV